MNTTIENTLSAENKLFDQRVRDFNRAAMAGYFRDYAIHLGGTGEKRDPLTENEYLARQKRNKVAKASRQFNRRKG